MPSETQIPEYPLTIVNADTETIDSLNWLFWFMVVLCFLQSCGK